MGAVLMNVDVFFTPGVGIAANVISAVDYQAAVPFFSEFARAHRAVPARADNEKVVFWSVQFSSF